MLGKIILKIDRMKYFELFKNLKTEKFPPALLAGSHSALYLGGVT